MKRYRRVKLAQQLKNICCVISHKLSLPSWNGVSVIVAIIAIVVSIYLSSPKSEYRITTEGEWSKGCPGGLVLPEEAQPGNPSDKVMKELYDSLQRRTLNQERFPSIATRGSLLYNIRNTSTGTNVASLQTMVAFSITVESIPNMLNIYTWGQCGAGGSYRRFPPINLTSDKSHYAVIEMYEKEDIDYFVLDKGSMEVFVFKFICGSPGVYRVTPRIFYNFGRTTQELAMKESPPLVCPHSMVEWIDGRHILNVNKLLKIGEITDDYVRLRRSPELRDDNVIVEMSRGTKAFIESEPVFNDNVKWVRVYMHDNTGWVSEQFLESVVTNGQ